MSMKRSICRNERHWGGYHNICDCYWHHWGICDIYARPGPSGSEKEGIRLGMTDSKHLHFKIFGEVVIPKEKEPWFNELLWEMIDKIHSRLGSMNHVVECDTQEITK